MSADLLAAFGSQDEGQQDTDKLSASKSVMHAFGNNSTTATNAQDLWILQSKPIPTQKTSQKVEQLWRQDDRGADVLFDASEDNEEDDEDDFGDFEEVPAVVNSTVEPEAVQTQYNNTDLLGLDEDLRDMQLADSAPVASKPNQRDYNTHVPLAVESSSQYKVNDFGTNDMLFDSTISGKVAKHPSPPQPVAVDTGDDEWGDFADIEGENQPTVLEPTRQIIKAESSHQPVPTTAHALATDDDDSDWDAFEEEPTTQTASASHTSTTTHNPTSTPHTPSTPQRPINIPPPSTLLQLLPQIYTSLSRSSQTQPPPSDLANLTLQIYITTARLISGRHQRWKRDPHLSQSMRISQAGLKSTGMKLTALDKSETIKEDQDAQEAIAAWQRHAATLNAVMLKAKVPRPPMSLNANMAVRGAAGPEVLTAKECCAVCGLKRNERVVGIDVKVEDSFGEFWVEHWGHKDCVDFWYTYEGLLNKR